MADAAPQVLRLEATLEGRVALVTGGASGIGLAIARALSAQGAAVVIADLNPERGQAAAASLPRARFERADVSSRDECRRLVEATAAVYGSLDVLVNNAGIQEVAPVHEYDPDTWDRLLAVLLTGPFLLTRLALPHMYARGWGRVINMSSAHGLVASPFKCAYVAAKHGLVGFTKVVALEAAPHGVTCNAICPGFTNTPLVQSQVAGLAEHYGIGVDEVVEKTMLPKHAIKRLVEPSEIGGLAAFLCSPAAASLTGAALPIDAGWTAQ
jgi:3-hydroxybutyrate dehydrogenase